MLNSLLRSGLVLLVLAQGSWASAKVLYVNNRLGSDRNDGRSPVLVDERTGPVKTIRMALKLARATDSIELANTGSPYYESISLVGTRTSGVSERPFELIGNGATLSGAVAIPEGSWQEIGNDVWRLSPFRKGSFVLMLNGQMLPEAKPTPGEVWTQLPELNEHQWCSWKGQIYVRMKRLIDPQSLPLSIAGPDCGITVYSTQHVRIRDLTVQHFRGDGIGIHDLARHIELNNVKLVENGRNGLCVSGSSEVTVSASEFKRNREHTLLIREAAVVRVTESDLDTEPAAPN